MPVMSMRQLRVRPVILLATALAFAGCWGDGRGFGVWVESSVSEPVIIVLTPGVDAPELEPRLAYLVRDTALRQSAWVLVGSDEDATGTIEVYSPACELRGSVDVRSGEYRVSIAADGTFTVARFEGLFGKGPPDAPDLERSPVDCAPPSPAPTSEPLIP
jgi:hypothetical protein